MAFLDENGLLRVWTKIKALVPTKTSDLVNDSEFVTSSAIHDATLTLKQNGTVKGTFSANASSNVEINFDGGGGGGGISLLDVYPVGSIYMSINNVSPQTLFGGTWEALQNRFLIGAGDSYNAGATGGNSSHTITTSEMPSHTHTFTGSSVATGNQSQGHTHSIPALSGTAGSKTLSGAVQLGGNVVMSSSSSKLTNGSGIISIGAVTAGMKTVSNSTDRGNVSQNSQINVNATHDHSVTTVANTTGGISANHTHNVTASGSNSNTGGGNAMDIMNPYLAVYMWKRIS